MIQVKEIGKFAIVRQRVGIQPERARHLELCEKLFGSEVWFDITGRIFMADLVPLPKKSYSFPKHMLIFPNDPRIDLSAEGSRYPNIKQSIIKEISGVEQAVRSVDHVLTANATRERRQVEAVKERTQHLLGEFMSKFRDLSDEELGKLYQETETMFQEQNLRPESIRDYRKGAMVRKTAAASGMKDRLGRRNPWISIQRLTSAYNQALNREQSIVFTDTKFTAMRTALLLEREGSRVVFENIARYLRPDAIPSSVLFKNPSANLRRNQLGIVNHMLNEMINQLARLVRLNPYRSEAAIVIAHLVQARDLLIEGGREREVGQNIIPLAYKHLTETLEQNRDIYPKKGE